LPRHSWFGVTIRHAESAPVFNYHRLETNLLQFLAGARNSTSVAWVIAVHAQSQN